MDNPLVALYSTLALCNQWLLPSAGKGPQGCWGNGLTFIAAHYTHTPPGFRSTFRDLLSKGSRRAFCHLAADIVKCIVASSAGYKPQQRGRTCFSLPAPFWWMLFNLEMLVLAPTAQADRDEQSINVRVQERILAFRSGNIKRLFDEAMAVDS